MHTIIFVDNVKNSTLPCVGLCFHGIITIQHLKMFNLETKLLLV